MNSATLRRATGWTIRDPVAFAALVIDRCAGREAGPFTPEDFAGMAGVSRSHIQKILAGGPCSRVVARSIVDRLGAPWLRVDDIFTTGRRLPTVASLTTPVAPAKEPAKGLGDVDQSTSESRESHTP